LAYITARYATLAPFGKAAALLSELLPMAGRRTRARYGTGRCAWARPSCGSRLLANLAQPTGLGVVGLDGGYVRNRHDGAGRHFEVIAGKVIDVEGAQHRFAFARNGQHASTEAFAQALAAAGVHADTPATVLGDGDAGLWRLQRKVLPAASSTCSAANAMRYPGRLACRGRPGSHSGTR
jgi:hypothetical protein